MLPTFAHSHFFSSDSAGADDECGSDIPIASIADAIVLAVYLVRSRGVVRVRVNDDAERRDA
jgi:hypothetical protein